MARPVLLPRGRRTARSARAGSRTSRSTSASCTRRRGSRSRTSRRSRSRCSRGSTTSGRTTRSSSCGGWPARTSRGSSTTAPAARTSTTIPRALPRLVAGEAPVQGHDHRARRHRRAAGRRARGHRPARGHARLRHVGQRSRDGDLARLRVLTVPQREGLDLGRRPARSRHRLVARDDRRRSSRPMGCSR